MEKEIVKQFQLESESWKNLLAGIQAENSRLKTRIAEIVSRDISMDLLEGVEDFQNRSISKDEIIALTRKDIFGFDKWITIQQFEDDGILEQALVRQKKIRFDIEKIEYQFNKLKSEFNNYLTENL